MNVKDYITKEKKRLYPLPIIQKLGFNQTVEQLQNILDDDQLFKQIKKDEKTLERLFRLVSFTMLYNYNNLTPRQDNGSKVHKAIFTSSLDKRLEELQEDEDEF